MKLSWLVQFAPTSTNCNTWALRVPWETGSELLLNHKRCNEREKFARPGEASRRAIEQHTKHYCTRADNHSQGVRWGRKIDSWKKKTPSRSPLEATLLPPEHNSPKGRIDVECQSFKFQRCEVCQLMTLPQNLAVEKEDPSVGGMRSHVTEQTTFRICYAHQSHTPQCFMAGSTPGLRIWMKTCDPRAR